MNLAVLDRQIAERADLAAIPDMTSAERANKLAEYRAEVDRLATEEEQTLDQLRLAGPDNVNLQAMRAVRALARQHRGAVLSFERLQKAIMKVEQADQPACDIPANADCTAQPHQHANNRKKRGR